jgi:hypothetical protein
MTVLNLLIAPISLVAALAGIYASWLWYQASKIEMPPFDPPLASMSDAPELHLLDMTVRQNEAFYRLAISGQLNAKAAGWTGLAALLTAISVLIGAL